MIQQNRRSFILLLCLFALCSFFLFWTFDDPLKIAKGFFFALSLIVIGIHDGLTHEIPNWMLLPVLATGLIDLQLVPALEGFFAASLVFLVASRLMKDSIGAGDIKFMAVTGWVLGPFGVTVGALIGELLFLLAYPFLQKFCEKKEAYAMAPWLGAGCFFAYLLVN